MDRTVDLRPFVAPSIKIWRLTMFKRRKSKSCWRDQQILNNNVMNYEFNCLKLHPWTNIATMVVWARAKLIFMFYTTVIHRLWPRCFLSRRAIGPLNSTTHTFSRLNGLYGLYGRSNDVNRLLVSFLDHRQLGVSIGGSIRFAVTHPYHSLLESWAHVDENDSFLVKEGQLSR
jgi:hypothetical protein